jgi:hypothetical protein
MAELGCRHEEPTDSTPACANIRVLSSLGQVWCSFQVAMLLVVAIAASPTARGLVQPVHRLWPRHDGQWQFPLQPTLRGSLSAVFNPRLASYGGDVGVSIAF